MLKGSGEPRVRGREFLATVGMVSAKERWGGPQPPLWVWWLFLHPTFQIPKSTHRYIYLEYSVLLLIIPTSHPLPYPFPKTLVNDRK